MKNGCCTVREWLGAFADGELDQARTEEVRRHLEACADCRRDLDQIRELNRLAKSVEHPQLAEDYWDWHRTRVWHGIRKAPRGRMPAFRPSFGWVRLATVAAGALVVLFVALAGWRTLFFKEGSVRKAGETPTELKRSAERRVAATAIPKGSGGQEAPGVAGSVSSEVEARSDELAGIPAEAAGRAEQENPGYPARSQGTASAAAASEPLTSPGAGAPGKTEVAAELRREEPQALSARASRSRVPSGRQSGHHIVSGPVLLEAPTIADADITDTGTVLLSVKTDSTGRVLSAAVRRSSGSKRLDSVALRQVRQSRFKAAVRNNRNVSSTFDYPVSFQKKPAAPTEQQKPQQAPGKREQKVQPQQNQSTDDRSKKPDSGKKDTPRKERTSR